MIVVELSSAYNPGDSDPGRIYPHVKISAYHFYPDSQHIQIYPQYGSASLTSSYWSPGVAFLGSRDIAGGDYASIIASSSLPDELPFAASDRLLHKWLLENHLTGTLLSSSF